jgi:predicted AlkP superfamily phosphohydrolase/phosphomutase
VLASLVALLLVKCGSPVAVGLLEPQGRLWWRWLLAFYLPIALGVGILVTVVTTALRSPRLSRVVLQAISAGVLLTLLVMNWACTIALLTGADGSGPSWMVGGAAILALLALGALAAGLSWTRPNTVRGVSLLAAAACFAALPGAYSEMPDLNSVIPRAVSSTNERLLVIGLDGADWDYLDPLIDRGELPNLLALRETGAWGELETVRPTRSAPIWTSVVTGVEPRRHGVVNNSVERLRGSYHRLPNTLPLPRGLAVALVESLLRRGGYISPSTVASFDRRVPAFWNIATRNNSSVDFVNWWASWPVEQIRGHMVSDRTHFWRSQAKGHSADRGFVTYPDSLLLDLSSLIMRPDQVTREHALEFMEVSADEFEEMKTTPYRHHRLKSEFKYLYSMFVSNIRISLHLMDSSRQEIGQPSDQFVLLRIIDQASHQALEYSDLVEDHLKSTPEEIEKYSQVVTRVYRAADQAVGQLVEAFGEGNVVILSDHGFKLLRPRSRYATYGHFGASTPDGIFIASGPAFQPGPVEGLGIYDMMPLLLALKGWPVAKDFVRGVPAQVFRESFLEQHPAKTIDSYGTMAVSLPAEGPIVADDEMIERLRALGYLD